MCLAFSNVCYYRRICIFGLYVIFQPYMNWQNIMATDSMKATDLSPFWTRYDVRLLKITLMIQVQSKLGEKVST